MFVSTLGYTTLKTSRYLLTRLCFPVSYLQLFEHSFSEYGRLSETNTYIYLLTNDKNDNDDNNDDDRQFIITGRKRSLRQGNVFTHVCHSVHG